jgi:hypothetical protein
VSLAKDCHRLITLAQLMKPFNASFFLSVTQAWELLWHDERLIEGSPHLKTNLDEERRQHWVNILAVFENACAEIGLGASIATIQEMRNALRVAKSAKEITALGLELLGRLRDETAQRMFWSLSLGEADYYNNPRKGWENIIERFGDSVSDIEEARKCFALSRYPAAIFHSLQVVEIGLLELGKFISVTDPHSGWTAVAAKLKTIVSKPYKQRSDWERQNFSFLEQVQGTVEALKDAWRNKIVHTQARLALMSKDFSAEIAEEILFATRAFMRRLADGLPTSSG